MNARTGILSDMSNDDKFHVNSSVPPRHSIYTTRNNCDQIINNNGLKLIDLCKSYDMQIANGRSRGDRWENFTNFLILLSNRKQRVVINGSASEWGVVESGVPQGSVLGPLPFSIYIKDRENGIKSQVTFFADDTSLFSIVQDPNISANELNHDLKLISLWAYQWKTNIPVGIPMEN